MRSDTFLWCGAGLISALNAGGPIGEPRCDRYRLGPHWATQLRRIFAGVLYIQNKAGQLFRWFRYMSVTWTFPNVLCGRRVRDSVFSMTEQ